MMFHQRRYKKYMRLKKLLDDGALGAVKRVQLENSRYFRTWMYHRSGSWRSSWAGEGGGALLNQGQHILDIWQWLFGMPISIYAVIPYGKYNDFMVDDEATLLMEYPQQRTATFILSTGEGSYTERLEIVGTKGTALLEKDTLTLQLESLELPMIRGLLVAFNGRVTAGAGNRPYLSVTLQPDEKPLELLQSILKAMAEILASAEQK